MLENDSQGMEMSSPSSQHPQHLHQDLAAAVAVEKAVSVEEKEPSAAVAVAAAAASIVLLPLLLRDLEHAAVVTASLTFLDWAAEMSMCELSSPAMSLLRIL